MILSNKQLAIIRTNYEVSYKPAHEDTRDFLDTIADLQRQLDHSENLYKRTLNDAMAVLNEKADLERQLAERDRIAYPIIGIPSAKDFARQCDPFEPDSETTTGTCAHWRDKVEKVFAQVRSIFDAYVQEKVESERKMWQSRESEEYRQALLKRAVEAEKRAEKAESNMAKAVLAESEWWHPHAPIHHLDYMEEFGKECPCIKCRRLAVNRAKVKAATPADPQTPREVGF